MNTCMFMDFYCCVCCEAVVGCLECTKPRSQRSNAYLAILHDKGTTKPIQPNQKPYNQKNKR